MFCNPYEEAQTGIGAIDHEDRLHNYAEYKRHSARLLKHFLREGKMAMNMQMRGPRHAYRNNGKHLEALDGSPIDDSGMNLQQ